MNPATDMARQARAKNSEKIGKGKVTPVQIAYIVDQYLSENLFTQTRSSFRSEASSLISKTPLQEGPKGLLSLEAIIDEYVSLKEQKMVVQMEKRRMEQESFRVQSLLQGMQNVMNAYDASAPAVAPSGQIVKVPSLTPSCVARNISQSSTTTTQIVVDPLSKKRQASSMAPCPPTDAKKSRSKIPNKQLSDGNRRQLQQPATLRPSTSGCAANMSPVEGPSASQAMFHQTKTTSATQNSSDPVTPTRVPSAHRDKNASPLGQSPSTDSSNKSTPPDFTSNCTIVSTKTVIVSPFKKAAYYSVEKHCSSACSPSKGDLQRATPIKRDRVKGRLNFESPDESKNLEKSTANESSTCESDDGNIFDLDLSILDFDISELLDFDMHCEQQDDSHHQVITPGSDNGSSPVQESTFC